MNGLQATVTSGNPWGADGPGTAFGMAYTMVLGKALESFGSHVDLLGNPIERPEFRQRMKPEELARAFPLE